MRNTSILIAALVALPLLAIKQSPIEFPDSIGAFTKNGCNVSRVVEPEGNISWHVSVWMDGAAILPRWERRSYSIREQRTPALQDCDRWMGEVEKRIKQDRKK